MENKAGLVISNIVSDVFIFDESRSVWEKHRMGNDHDGGYNPRKKISLEQVEDKHECENVQFQIREKRDITSHVMP